MRDFFSRHSHVALMFSGGRDSMACLLLCREWWDRITVVWVNAGNPYEETIEQMRRVRSMVPKFVEVLGRQPDFIKERGYPLDVVPIGMTPIGRSFGRSSGVSVVPYTDCCAANLWQPATAHIEEAGYTGIVRGDRDSDALRSSVTSGDVVNGIEFIFPLAAWSDEDVIASLGDDLPDSYKRGVSTSLDCRNCTAYMHHNVERIKDLQMTDPQAHAEVTGVLGAVALEIKRHTVLIQNAGVSE